MNLRITASASARSALASVRRATANVALSQEQIASGRRINRPSDAPLDAAHAQRLHVHKAKLDQYQRTLEQAQSTIEFSASSAQELSDILIRAREDCLEGANATMSASDRRNLALDVDQLLKGVLNRANTKFDDRYIFAGTATDTAPFVGQLGASGYIESVAYRGDDGRIQVEVGPRTRVQTNEPGSAVFGTSGGDPSVFDALIQLRNLLQNEAGLSDNQVSQALSDHVGALGQAQERVLDATARLGWRSNQLELTRTSLENTQLANSQLLGELEDADIAAAAARLYSQEAALEAAMVVSARMLRNSLLDYLQ